MDVVAAIMREAHNNKTDPPTWCLSLTAAASGATSGAVREIQQVTPTNLERDFSTVTSPPATCRNAATPQTTPNHGSQIMSPHEFMLPQSTPSPAPPIANPVAQEENRASRNFTLKANDMPSDLKLEGLVTEDIPEVMALYRSHIQIMSPEKTLATSVLDYRAIKHLPRLVRGAAATSLSLILSSSLEWRPESQLARLRAQGARIVISPPTTWDEWVTAFTTLFSPANRISLLAREVMTLQAKPSESVDSYSLRVSQAYSRFLAEAKRTAPPNVEPHEHAFSQAMIASFENGLPPDVRVEMIREDASTSFMASKTRARKHEANKLRSPAHGPATTAAVASVHDPSQRMFDLGDRVAALETYVSHEHGYNANNTTYTAPQHRIRGDKNNKLHRQKQQQKQWNKPQNHAQNGQSGGGSTGSGSGSASSKSGSSSSTQGSGGKKKKGVAVPCDYVGCSYNPKKAYSHTRENCRLEQEHKEAGLKFST